ncbi:MAG: hypothetical protein IPJ65_23185 [Archangiaceae bacterium]|nr:hypothetical protein [Archangiaceae bacterium]
MRMGAVLLRVGVLAVTLASGPAAADPDPLGEARQRAAQLDYPGALEAVRAALARGGSAPPQTLALYAYLGELAATVGDPAAAEAAFAVTLQLSPSFELPAGTSPKVRAPLERARARGLTPLGASVEPRVLQGSQVELEVRLSTGAKVEAVRLSTAGPNGLETRPLSGSPVARGVFTCAASPCGYFVSLLDGDGNELLRVGSPLAPLTVPGAAPAPVPGPAPRRAPVLGLTLAALAVVAAAVAIGFGVLFGTADGTLARIEADRSRSTFAAAQGLDGQRRLGWWSMWGAGGAALALGVAAGALW